MGLFLTVLPSGNFEKKGFFWGRNFCVYSWVCLFLPCLPLSEPTDMSVHEMSDLYFRIKLPKKKERHILLELLVWNFRTSFICSCSLFEYNDIPSFSSCPYYLSIICFNFLSSHSACLSLSFPFCFRLMTYLTSLFTSASSHMLSAGLVDFWLFGDLCHFSALVSLNQLFRCLCTLLANVCFCCGPFQRWREHVPSSAWEGCGYSD